VKKTLIRADLGGIEAEYWDMGYAAAKEREYARGFEDGDRLGYERGEEESYYKGLSLGKAEAEEQANANNTAAWFGFRKSSRIDGNKESGLTASFEHNGKHYSGAGCTPTEAILNAESSFWFQQP